MNLSLDEWARFYCVTKDLEMAPYKKAQADTDAASFLHS
jgi:hypothetical protein